MNNGDVPISDMTPCAQRFFYEWISAARRYEFLKKGRPSDIRQVDWMENLENGLREYQSASKFRDELHPEAHLMLMMTVKGGWFARWRSELKAAKLWRYQSSRFDANYESFMHFYREQHELNDRATGTASETFEE